MPKNKAKKDNIKGMSATDLVKKLAEVREQVRTIHFKSVGAKAKNVKEGATLKKDIARIMTEIRAQELNA